MKTFLEYMSETPTKRYDLTRKEVEFLLKAREQLAGTEFGDELFDNTSDLESPYIWVQLPKDIGGGARIYIVFGSLAVRLQRSKKDVAVGPAYKVVGLDAQHDDEAERMKDVAKKAVNRSFEPDMSAINKLHGELQNIIRKVREVKKAQRKAIFSSPGQSSEFRGFWGDNPSPAPLY